MSAQMIRMCSIIGPPEVEPRVRQLRRRIASPCPQSPGVAARSSKGGPGGSGRGVQQDKTPPVPEDGGELVCKSAGGVRRLSSAPWILTGHVASPSCGGRVEIPPVPVDFVPLAGIEPDWLRRLVRPCRRPSAPRESVQLLSAFCHCQVSRTRIAYHLHRRKGCRHASNC